MKSELGVEARLVEGGLGEFSIWVGDDRVTGKERRFLIFSVFPSDAVIVAAVRDRLARPSRQG